MDIKLLLYFFLLSFCFACSSTTHNEKVNEVSLKDSLATARDKVIKRDVTREIIDVDTLLTDSIKIDPDF